MFRVLLLILIVMSSVAFAQIKEKPEAYKIFEFEKTSSNILKGKLAEFRTELKRVAGSQGYIINYGTDKEIVKRESQIQNSMIFGDIDALRITLVRGGNFGKSRVVIWIVPEGAESPKLISSAYKFDEFSKVSERQLKRKLDKFAEKITCGQENSFYVIIYPTKKDNLDNLGKKYLDRLVRLRCIDPPRIIIVKGSIQKIQKTELWIVPSGADAPII
jgi:hypothetical protein